MNYQKEYDFLKEKMDGIKERINKVLKSYAKENCPFKAGDVTKILGYSHYGKNGIVIKINGKTNYDNELRWKIIGIVLRKDGTESRVSFNFDEDNYDEENK